MPDSPDGFAFSMQAFGVPTGNKARGMLVNLVDTRLAIYKDGVLAITLCFASV